MRLSASDKLYGQPILKIREVIRYAMTERLISLQRLQITNKVAKVLGESKKTSEEVLKQLIKDDYLVLDKVRYGKNLQFEVRETLKGRRFGIASANPSITREKANMLLKELLERAEAINANHEFVYYIERLSVFGSYLSDKPMLSDLDIFYKMTHKFQDEKREKDDQRIDLALKTGRVFPNFIEQLHWPEREVLLALKTKKKGLSLHDEDADNIYHKTESRIVFTGLQLK